MQIFVQFQSPGISSWGREHTKNTSDVAFTNAVEGVPHANEQATNLLVLEDTRPTTGILHCSPLWHGCMAKLVIV